MLAVMHGYERFLCMVVFPFFVSVKVRGASGKTSKFSQALEQLLSRSVRSLR